MIFNLKSRKDTDSAFQYLTDLAAKEIRVDIKKVSEQRSKQQNNYLYLLLADFAMHFGYTKEQAKSVYKDVNKDIYYRKFRMNEALFLHIRSSADLTKEEMAKSVDRFMQFSAEQGHPLPPATDQGWLDSIYNEAERREAFL